MVKAQEDRVSGERRASECVLQACGLARYRHDGAFTMGRYLRDILSSPIIVPVRSEAEPTAGISFNDHQDHFRATWGLGDRAGEAPITRPAGDRLLTGGPGTLLA